MKLIVNGIEKEITLRAWEEGNGWRPDCFADLETRFTDGQEITAAEYAEMVEWWQEEVDTFNRGEWSEFFGDPEESFDKEFGFWFDEI